MSPHTVHAGTQGVGEAALAASENGNLVSACKINTAPTVVILSGPSVHFPGCCPRGGGLILGVSTSVLWSLGKLGQFGVAAAEGTVV